MSNIPIAEENKAALVKTLREGLPGFTGSQSFTKYPWGLALTEGAVWLAETASCFWLLDVIGTHAAFEPLVKKESFLVCKLLVNEKSAWSLTFEDGDYNYVGGQKGSYTDFPLPEITLWAVNGEFGRHVMLPSEY